MQTLQEPVDHLLEIKKSRFFGRVEPITSQAEGLELIEQLRHQHPEARHVCFCMLNKGQVRQSDDGEPSGTAAAPMLNVLQHKQLDNVLASVVRYFGGIKLGAGGLVRAYSQTISQALQQAQFVSLVELDQLQLAIGFEHESLLRHLANQYKINLDLTYTNQVVAQLEGEKEHLQALLASLTEQVSGQVQVIAGFAAT